MLRSILLLGTAVAGLAAPAAAETLRFTKIYGGRNVGHLIVDRTGPATTIDYDYKNNGRGPTIKEQLTVGSDGLPTQWTISGATTFGSKVAESFSQGSGQARWHDAAGDGTRQIAAPGLYVPQAGSPWADQLIATALLKRPDRTMAVLPGGTLRLDKGETLSVQGASGPVQVTRYDIVGNSLEPEMILLDGQGRFFAQLDSNSILVREGYEAEAPRLIKLAGDWTAGRYAEIQKAAAHRYEAPVRIRNVRLFDPARGTLTALVSVLVSGRQIAGIEPLDSPATPGEVSIDGNGGTLVPGFFEMHAHLDQQAALMNVLAGITTVRDMGNDNAVLAKLIDRIDAGEVAGPRVIRAGFIEGKSPFSANNGFVVDSQEKALEAVRWYAARGYWQIKIYNSMNPAWVPAMVQEAHRLGLRVGGHVPAFATADQMIAAGYDEMTHINQFMLGWVIKPNEDTRTLFRLYALKRLPALDLNSAPVRKTVDAMVAGHKAIDPTLGIHEWLLTGRDGQVPPGDVDYFDHMPIGWQRDARKALTDITTPEDDRLYRGAYAKILETTKLLNQRGVFIVFGTDTGGAFTYHRELEIYQQVGMTPAQILSRATLETAHYVGQDQRLGSIAKDKLADFFLIQGDPTRDLKAIKAIRMVVKDGAFYYPSEVYTKLGIKPFAEPPKVVEPATAS